MEKDTHKHTYAEKKESFDLPLLVRNLTKIIVGIFVILAVVIAATGYESDIKEMLFGVSERESDLGAQDAVIINNLKSMQASAEIYKRRLTDYGGVCESIGIDHSVYTCNEDGDAYTITAELSDGRFYCVDSTGFSDITPNSLRGGVSCPQ